MKMMKCLAVLAILAVGTARANLVENFEGYSDGSLVSQNSNWSGSSNWQIATNNGNKILVLSYPAADIGLLYTGEQFSAAGEGYTMITTMYAASGGYWASKYSGLLCDANLDSPTSADHAHRFHPADGTSFLTIGGGSLGGSYSIPWDTMVNLRQYRSGENVQVYVSDSPFSADNPGSLILSGTAPSLGTGGNYVGLYGVGTVAFDNIGFYQGNYVPEPMTIGLLTLGGLLLRRRM